MPSMSRKAANHLKAFKSEVVLLSLVVVIFVAILLVFLSR